jgi:hypothetical protein
MRPRYLIVVLGLAVAASAADAAPQGGAPAVLSAATAEKMAGACVAYAKQHNGAVNIWIYDGAGAVLHFQRMDGAPRVGAGLGGNRSGMIGGNFDDPTAFNAGAPGAVPVVLAGRSIGTARAEGMGAIGDRACAQAAAAAAGG